MLVAFGKILAFGKIIAKMLISEIKYCPKFALKCQRGKVGKLDKTGWQNVYNDENKTPVENWVPELQYWN